MGKKSKNKHIVEGGLSNTPNSADMAPQTKESNPETVMTLFADAEAAIDSFDFETAADSCQQILKIDSENVDAMDMLGSIYAELGTIDEAKSLWLKCVELSPNSGYKKYFGLAQVYAGKESLNFYEKGIRLLEQLLEGTENVQPEQDASSAPLDALKLALSEGYCAIAELYMTDLCDEENAGDLCKVAVDKSISIKPENADPYRILASFLVIQGKLEEAKSAVEKNLDLWYNDYEAMCNNPDNDVETEIFLPEYSTRMEIGKILIELEMFEQAVKIFEGLLEEDDEVVLVWYLLGILYYSRGENYYETAFHYFTKANEVARKSGEDETDEVLHAKEILEILKSAKSVSENGELEGDDDDDDLNQHFSSDEGSEEEIMES